MLQNNIDRIDAMKEELDAFEANDTWELTVLPGGNWCKMSL